MTSRIRTGNRAALSRRRFMPRAELPGGRGAFRTEPRRAAHPGAPPGSDRAAASDDDGDARRLQRMVLAGLAAAGVRAASFRRAPATPHFHRASRSCVSIVFSAGPRTRSCAASSIARRVWRPIICRSLRILCSIRGCDLGFATFLAGVIAPWRFKLYNAPQSTCSQRVRFVLNAKGLPFEEVKLDLLAGDQLKPEYLALNPNGVVPTLDHDGAIIIDSSVIIEYLDEIAPAGKFHAGRPVSAGKDARIDALHRRDAGGGSARSDLQSRLPAALCRDERGGVPGFRGIEAAAQGVHAGDGPQGISGEGYAGRARSAGAHLSSAWTMRSRRAAGRGCKASGRRLPTSR